MVEERALSCKCGWPCCGAGISRRNAELVGDDSQPLVYASGATQTLYNMRAALQFCSLACNRAARVFMAGLDTSALGLRPCYARRMHAQSAPADAPLPETNAHSVIQEHEPDLAALDSTSSEDEEEDEDEDDGDDNDEEGGEKREHTAWASAELRWLSRECGDCGSGGAVSGEGLEGALSLLPTPPGGGACTVTLVFERLCCWAPSPASTGV